MYTCGLEHGTIGVGAGKVGRGEGGKGDPLFMKQDSWVTSLQFPAVFWDATHGSLISLLKSSHVQRLYKVTEWC